LLFINIIIVTTIIIVVVVVVSVADKIVYIIYMNRLSLLNIQKHKAPRAAQQLALGKKLTATTQTSSLRKVSTA